MRSIVLGSLAAGVTALSLVVPPAQAGPVVPGPEGRLCSFAALSDPDPNADDSAMVGEVNAGPAVWDRAFRLDCTVRLDVNAHTTPAAATAGAGSVGDGATHVAVLPPTPIAYDLPEAEQPYLCASATYDDGGTAVTIYRTDGWVGPDDVPHTEDDTPATCSTDPGRPCRSAPTNLGPGRIPGLAYALAKSEQAACGALAGLHTTLALHGGPAPDARWYVDHEGDVFVTVDGSPVTEATWRDTIVWDCPGYADYASHPYGPGADGVPVMDP